MPSSHSERDKDLLAFVKSRKPSVHTYQIAISEGKTRNLAGTGSFREATAGRMNQQSQVDILTPRTIHEETN